MKCTICKKKIDETFLKKIKGTYVKKQGKRHVVCNDCQKIHKEDIVTKVK